MEDCGLQTEALQIIIRSLSSSKLYTLDFSFNDITTAVPLNDIACSDVTDKNCSLNNLYLDGNNVNSLENVNFKFSAVFPILTDLCIDSDIISDFIKIALINGIMPNLKTLISCHHKYKKKAVIVFTNSSQHVKKIMLSKQIGFSGTDSIAMPCRLNSLMLTVYIKMDLETISISFNDSVFLKHAGIMTSISTLKCCEELVCCNLTDDQMIVEIITNIIKNNANLKIISLSRYYSSPIEFHNQHKLRSCNASATAVKQILFVIQHVRLLHLEILNLSGNSIEKDAAKTLSGIIANCTVLEVLLLAGCNLKSENLQRIGHSLTMISSLKFLDLSHNKIAEDSFTIIVAIISSNKNLQELYLNNNCFHLHESINEFWISLQCINLSVLCVDGDLLSINTLDQLANFNAAGCRVEHLLFVDPCLIGIGKMKLPKCLETIYIYL